MKNLETEYKNQISHEAPDLWDRIEAGIDKIEAEKANGAANTDLSQAASSEGSFGYTDQKNNAPLSETAKQIKKFNSRKVLYTIGKYSAVAVALIAVFLTVNVLRNGIGRDSAPSPAANTVAPSGDKASSNKHFDAAAEADYSPAAEEPEYYSDAANEAPSYSEEPSYSNEPTEPVTSPDPEDDRSADVDSKQPLIFGGEELYEKTKEQLITKLDALGFSDISELKFNKFNPARDDNIYMASFINNENGLECSVYFIYEFTVQEVDIDIRRIYLKDDFDTVYYRKTSDD